MEWPAQQPRRPRHEPARVSRGARGIARGKVAVKGFRCREGPAASGAAEPTTATKTPGAGPIVHRVRPGETLWSIALAYRTTVEALRAANHFLFSRQLQVGDLLMIQPPH